MEGVLERGLLIFFTLGAYWLKHHDTPLVRPRAGCLTHWAYWSKLDLFNPVKYILLLQKVHRMLNHCEI